MRHMTWAVFVGCVLALEAPARGQAVAEPSVPVSGRASSGPWWYAAPGFYGTSWGYSSYGMPRTYSSFASPFGAGYGYGYGPSALAPGPYGWSLWRPGVSAPGYTYSPSAIYNTTGGLGKTLWYGQGPPIGAYAPYLGPGGGAYPR
jgi:hypothetical protein